MYRLALALFVLLTSSALVRAEDALRIGLIAPMSGPLGVMGQEVADGFKLGLKVSGGKLGGIPVQLIVEDDQGKPDVARQVALELLERDHANLIVAGGLSNALLAFAQPVLTAHTILLSVNPGSSDFAGKGCSPYFFNVSFQNDTLPETAGKYFSDEGIQRAFFLAPNYQGGRDTLAGFKRYYQGHLENALTPLTQLDFAPALAEIQDAKPQAVFFFYPGALEISFVKQWAQSGIKGVRLMTQLSLDQTVLPAIGDAALGIYVSSIWSEQLTNPENVKFVADFRKTYGRIPATYAATAYDGTRLIDAAVKEIDGKVSDTESLRKAMEAVHFNSVRGKFRLGHNHFPIQDHFMAEVVKNDDGSFGFAPRKTVFIDHEDAYARDCAMK